MDKIFECVSFLLIKNDQILLEQRSPFKESDPGIIAIPGGHIEQGENQLDALYRELKEELAITPSSSTYLCSLYHPTNTELQLLHYYIVPEWEGQIQSLEADAVEWYSIHRAPLITTADKVALSEFVRLRMLLTDRTN